MNASENENNGKEEFAQRILTHFRGLQSDQKRFFVKIVKDLARASQTKDDHEIRLAKDRVDRIIKAQKSV